METDIWNYHKFLGIKAFVVTDSLFVLLTIPLVNKTLTFLLYRLQDLPLLHPKLQKYFQYDLPHKYLTVTSAVQYITSPKDNYILSCAISAGH